MDNLVITALNGCLVLILTSGVVSACAARLSVGCRCQGMCQALFLGCLLAVGLAAMIGLILYPGRWAMPAMTLSVMVLMATCDFGRSRGVAAW